MLSQARQLLEATQEKAHLPIFSEMERISSNFPTPAMRNYYTGYTVFRAMAVLDQNPNLSFLQSAHEQHRLLKESLRMMEESFSSTQKIGFNSNERQDKEYLRAHYETNVRGDHAGFVLAAKLNRQQENLTAYTLARFFQTNDGGMFDKALEKMNELRGYHPVFCESWDLSSLKDRRTERKIQRLFGETKKTSRPSRIARISSRRS